MPSLQGFDLFGEVQGLQLSGRPTLAKERLLGEAFAMLADENLIEAAYSYSIVELDQPAAIDDQVLYLGGTTLPAPKLIPDSGRLTALACAVATIGSKAEQRVTALFAERRTSLAVAVDELSNQFLFAAARHAGDRIHADVAGQKLTMAGELHAGDPGLELDAQRTVLRLAEAQKIGVEMKGDHLMTPLKSSSMVFGVGKDLPAATWSRCDSCPSRANGKCQFGNNGKEFLGAGS